MAGGVTRRSSPRPRTRCWPAPCCGASAHGPARLAGLPLDLPAAYLSVEDELEAFSRVTVDDLAASWPGGRSGP